MRSTEEMQERSHREGQKSQKIQKESLRNQILGKTSESLRLDKPDFIPLVLFVICMFFSVVRSASLSKPRIWLAATSGGDLAFFAGGENDDGTAIYSTVDIFD